MIKEKKNTAQVLADIRKFIGYELVRRENILATNPKDNFRLYHEGVYASLMQVDAYVESWEEDIGEQEAKKIVSTNEGVN